MMDRIRTAARPKVDRLHLLCFSGLALDLFVAPQVFSSNTGNTVQAYQNVP